MAEISWTDEAQRWLTDIFEYIAADNPQAAARTVQGITTVHKISRVSLRSVRAIRTHRATCAYCSTDITESHTSSKTTEPWIFWVSFTGRSTSPGINSSDT